MARLELTEIAIGEVTTESPRPSLVASLESSDYWWRFRRPRYYYAACAIGRVDPAEGIKPIWGCMLALLVGLIIVAIIPWFSIGFL